jgi:hypothetical protein
MNGILDTIILIATMIFALFVPGASLMLLIRKRNSIFYLTEKLVISLGLSILVIDFLMLMMNRIGISLNRLNLLLFLIVFAILCLAINRFRKKYETGSEEKLSEKGKLYDFSGRQLVLLLFVVFLTLFFKIYYTSGNILPSSTDLGHHMYWSKMIAQSERIPDYTQKDIIEVDGRYVLSQPNKISDFIIGEHLIFSAVGIISGSDFVSSFPILILFIINFFSILAVFIMVQRFFEDVSYGKEIAIISLLFLGVLFDISPPAQKYVSGGVIGNTIGNFFLPLIIYFFYRSFREKSWLLMIMALFFSVGLFYTHHLTGLLFIIIAVSIMLGVIILDRSTMIDFWKKVKSERNFWISLAAFFILAGIFVFLVYTPSYIKNSAVDSVVGEPVKEGHEGLPFNAFVDIVGESRAALALAGMILLLFIKKVPKFIKIILIAWMAVITLVTLYPGFLRLSIPSGRVANYATYPGAILGAFAFIAIFYDRISTMSKKNKITATGFFLWIALILSLYFAINYGFIDNVKNLANRENPSEIRQTMVASKYLASRITPNEMAVSDHIYTTADSWIKLYFMRDYNFPLYRANLFRYDNGIDRQEQCTLWMISEPESERSKKCYSDLNVNYAIVSKNDSPYFRKEDSFSKVFTSDTIDIYERSI